MAKDFWRTDITRVRPGEIRIRGYDVIDMMGHLRFGDVVYLLMSGELPTGREGAMVEAILIAGADHSVAAPSAAATRLVASGGAPLQAAVAAGLIALDTHHGGAMEELAEILQATLATERPGGRVAPAPAHDEATLAALAVKVVAAARAAGRRLPGFGHPVHPDDPRTIRLRALAREWGLYGGHFRLVDAIAAELTRRGRKLTINVDGAIAGIMSDMGLSWRIGRGFYVIARAAGLVAHAFEQVTAEKPFKAPGWEEIRYGGPEPRPVPGGER